MTALDAREWYRLDPDGEPFREQQVAVAKFKAAHPAVTFGRMTILGVERREPWLCIDGWLTPPDDQGLAPTDADIPMGVHLMGAVRSRLARDNEQKAARDTALRGAQRALVDLARVIGELEAF